jgi:type IV pilus assembly protein PilX
MTHKNPHTGQQGFVLVVTMILLTVVSLLVLGSMRSSVLGERMAGNSMDRNLAKLAAEQALTQGLAKLQANADMCLNSGCTSTTTPGVGIGASLTDATAPSVWSDTDAVNADASAPASAKYLVNWLDNVAFTPPTSSKSACKAYSVMGRGVGKNSLSVVILQTIAYVCPAN